MTKKDQPADPVGDVDMSAEERDAFVLKNRYSPEREAVMRAHREAALAREALPSSAWTPEGVRQPRRGEVTTDFSPADHTIAEIEEYVEAHPDHAEAILEAEQAGEQPRVGVVEAMERRLRSEPESG
jgi:hypothetical protein